MRPPTEDSQNIFEKDGICLQDYICQASHLNTLQRCNHFSVESIKTSVNY